MSTPYLSFRAVYKFLHFHDASHDVPDVLALPSLKSSGAVACLSGMRVVHPANSVVLPEKEFIRNRVFVLLVFIF